MNNFHNNVFLWDREGTFSDPFAQEHTLSFSLANNSRLCALLPCHREGLSLNTDADATANDTVSSPISPRILVAMLLLHDLTNTHI